MKKFLSCLVLASLVFISKAQNLSLNYGGNDLANGDTVTVYAEGETELVAEGVYGWAIQFQPTINNNSTRPVTAKITVDKLNETSSYVGSICAGQCLEGNESTPFSIAAEGSYTNAYIDFVVPEQAADGLFKVNVFEVDDPTNLTSIYVIVKRPLASIATINQPTLLLYPNPATTSVAVSFANANGATLSICDMKGTQVRTAQLSGNEGSTIVSLEGLATGVYFCIITTAEGNVKTQKLVVK